MIEELRAVAAMASVNRPIRVNAGDVEASFIFHTTRDLVAGNLFAGVFGDLAPLLESDGGETAFAVNPGRSDFNARGLFDLLAGLSHLASVQNTGNGR